MILGVDMAKKSFDATLILKTGASHYAHFENDEKGFKKLSKWLKKYEVESLHACMEATNIYWEALAEYLSEEGYEVSVVNPARIKGFALSQLRRNKTDKLDSQVIAQFCQQSKPSLWKAPTPEQKQLRAYVRHGETLKKILTQDKNRLSTCQDPQLRELWESRIELTLSQMAEVEAKINELIKQDADLAHKYKLLCSVKGIGSKTAVIFLAEMYDLAEYDTARAAAADTGLTPSHYRSGTSVNKKPKLSKVGKAAVRGILFMPAMTAIRHNPIVRALKERLEARGKPKMVILGAAMRKLVHLAYGVLKNNTPFDPNYVN